MKKPVTNSEFGKTVEKALSFFSQSQFSSPEDNEIFIKRGLSFMRIKFKDIVYISSEGKGIVINTNSESYPVHFTLKAILNHIPSGMFSLIDNTVIINRQKINAIRNNSLDLVVGNELKNIPLNNPISKIPLNADNLTLFSKTN